MRRIRNLTLAATVATFALIAVGGLVRATGSGLGCPGWPRCFGRWIPPLAYHPIIEYSHRFLATVVVVLVGAVLGVAIRRHRTERRILFPSIAAAVLVIGQAALGAIVVEGSLPPALVTAHLATAMLLAGDLVFLLVQISLLSEGRPPRASVPRSLAWLSIATAGAVYVLVLIGAYVRGEGAGLAFGDWPLMNGKLVPALEGIATVQFAHRVAAALAALLVLYLAIRIWTLQEKDRTLSRLAVALVGLFAAQILVGALNVWTQLAPAAVVAHVTLAGLIWGTTVAIATLAARRARLGNTEPAADPSSNGHRKLKEKMAAYFSLTKPRIIVLLLVTTIPAMILAAGSLPPFPLMFATLFGGTLAAGSANSINCYLDRDIDEVMRRTRRRPLPAHAVSPDAALTFGFVLGACSFVFLGITVNVLAAVLALSAIGFYVFVYTAWLKRSTAQNIVIGGAAGAVPVLVGWAAVTGTVGLPALVLFAIVFVWTPPHFWALAMRYTGDYEQAGVPMLPVVRGHEETMRQILLYSLVLFATSLVLAPVAHTGAIYLLTAIVLGGIFVYRAAKLWRISTPALAMGLFKYSILYLSLLFAAVAADRLVPLGRL
jgi:protoheme IX farnesyltransferase